MKSLKTKYGLIVFILLLLVLSTLLGVLFTQGRYEKEVLSSSDIYDGEMEYIVAEQVEVNSVEELIAAIENGYSNIKIADGVDNPLIITSGVTDVGTDLILDLNGHEIQRNNREPMLNIQNGVRLTIIDTSVEQSGSFYNPVGSVLRIGGGTLTVSAGAFVSGPKKSEYAEESGGHWSADRENGGGTIDGTTAAVTLYVKDESGENYEGSAANMPVITPHVEEATYSAGETQQYWFVNGNMYFDTDPAFGADAYGGKIEGDTYLYYVLDDDSVSTTTIAAEGSANFRYSAPRRRRRASPSILTSPTRKRRRCPIRRRRTSLPSPCTDTTTSRRARRRPRTMRQSRCSRATCTCAAARIPRISAKKRRTACTPRAGTCPWRAAPSRRSRAACASTATMPKTAMRNTCALRTAPSARRTATPCR